MLGDLDLDEEIEDAVANDDMRRGVGQNRDQQKMHYVQQ